MVDLTRFKDVLGKPGQGIHFHIAGIAIVDVIATILVGWLLAWGLGVNPLWTITGLFVLGEALHLLFGVNSAFVKLVFRRGD